MQESVERISRNSTIAVARWISGEEMSVAIEAGRETWEIFGELAVRRAATLDQVTWRCFWWRNVMAEVLGEIATQQGTSPQALIEALNILQLSLEFSLLRMCECFEEERRETDEKLGHREEELAFLATHDALTDLPNRTLVLDRVEQMLARSRRTQHSRGGALHRPRQLQGHQRHARPRRRRRTAAGCRREARRRDPRDRRARRLGGDEFVVISEELSLAAGPELVAERLLEALAAPFNLGPDRASRVTVTASIGIAMAEDASAEELLRNADIAMYRAKWDGKNRYAIFEIGMQEKIQQRMVLEMDLRDAIANDEFFLAYHPTIDLRDMTPTGVEALIRWNHPERGVIQPDGFIPLLEDSGMIVEVGRWVLMQACAQGAAWRDSGLPDQHGRQRLRPSARQR